MVLLLMLAYGALLLFEGVTVAWVGIQRLRGRRSRLERVMGVVVDTTNASIYPHSLRSEPPAIVRPSAGKPVIRRFPRRFRRRRSPTGHPRTG